VRRAKRLFYPRVVFRRIDVQQQAVDDGAGGGLVDVELTHPEHASKVAQLESALLDLLTNRHPGAQPVTREQRLDPRLRPQPGPVGPGRQQDQPSQDLLVQKGLIAGDDQDGVLRRALEGRIESADGADIWNQVGVHLEAEVRKPIGVRRHHEDGASQPLQDLHLPYDDGQPFDDETALVLAAKSSGLSSCEDGRGTGEAGHGQIMTEARVGRLLAASLHQAIAEVLPDRLDFYEEWLRPDGLRDGSIGRAPLAGVIGFLRLEGDDYARVVARAGTLAADWTVLSMTSMKRRVVASLPRPLRARAAMRMAAALVRDVQSTSRVAARVRRDQVRLDLNASLFCAVRGRETRPLCGFYAAAAVELMRRFGLRAEARIDECCAMAAGSCVITLTLQDAATMADPALAA
jgi:hypothetical protein